MNTTAEKTWADLAVGDYVWEFDPNRRHYTEPVNGRQFGDFIWRECWVKRQIVGENRASWILGQSYSAKKVPKRTRPERGYLISEQELDDACYVNDNRVRLGNEVQRLQYGSDDARKLREVEAILFPEGAA